MVDYELKGEPVTLRERINTAVRNNRGDLPTWRKNPFTDALSSYKRYNLAMFEIQNMMLETLPKMERESKEYNSLIGEMASRPRATLETIEITLKSWARNKDWSEKQVAAATIMLNVLERINHVKVFDVLKLFIDICPEPKLVKGAKTITSAKSELWENVLNALVEQPQIML